MAIIGSIIAGLSAAAAAAGGAATGGAAAAGLAAGATSAGAAAAGTAAAGTAAATAAGTAAGTGAATAAGTAAGTGAATTAATTTGGITAAGIGKGALSGAITGGLINAGSTAIQGGSVGDVAIEGTKGAAMGAVTGAVTAGMGQLFSNIGSKVADKVKDVGKVQQGTTTGTTPSATTATSAPTPTSSPSIGYKGTLPDLNNIGKNLAQKASVKTETAAAINGQTSLPNVQLKNKISIDKVGNKVTAPNANTSAPNANISAPNANTSAPLPTQAKQPLISEAQLQKAGQVGQGLLAIGTTIAGTKQAKAANEISKQGLLFQKQTYESEKAEREKTKASLKTDAYKAVTSSQSFASKLFDDNSLSNNLLTSYTSSDNNYSIFGSGLKSSYTDLT